MPIQSFWSSLAPTSSSPTTNEPPTSSSTTSVISQTIKTSVTFTSSSLQNISGGSNEGAGSSSTLSGFVPTTIPVTLSFPSSVASSSATFVPDSAQTPVATSQADFHGICIGNGIDLSAIGLVATTVLCSLVGLVLWVLFAYLRPKYRQLYAVREWFVSPEFRPRPLKKSFWAFLWPDVPFVPSLPDSDDAKAANYPRDLKRRFPSDEELSQRTLWQAFLIVAGWSIIGLGGALPLYLVDTPCIADSSPTIHFGGQYSTLQDLSLLRLLNLLQSNHIATGQRSTTYSILAIVNGKDVTSSTKLHLIILTVLVIVVAAIPAIFKLLHEFSKLIDYYHLWDFYVCENTEMAWLSKRHAPGFEGWGENQFKDFLISIGLSKGFNNSDRPNGTSSSTNARTRRNRSRTMSSDEDKARLDVNIHGLFTITDTSHLSQLIKERDVILNNLEMAEIQYINSFRLSTPASSINDSEVPEEISEASPATTSLKQQISGPKALHGRPRVRAPYSQKRHVYGNTTPTSYVAPSSYYKLRDVRGVSRLSSTNTEESLSQGFSQRVIGSRFQEIQRDSAAFGRIPLGSHVQLNEHTGILSPVPFSEERYLHGPNGPPSVDINEERAYSDTNNWVGGSQLIPRAVEGEIMTHSQNDVAHLRPPRARPPSDHRETFPMRTRQVHTESQTDDAPPLHLRLQTQQPFVRPVSGVDHEDLGVVYDNIRHWRSRLKAMNMEVAEAQQGSYNHIAQGTYVKGWLLIGRGLRFLPHVELIEGRCKEDIRYDELQLEQDGLNGIGYWTIVAMVSILLGVGFIAVAGLAVSSAPEVAHYLSFLSPLARNNNIGSALAITIAPSLVAIAFTLIAIYAIHHAAKYFGSISISKTRMMAFKAVFILLAIVCCLWLFICGSLIFSLQAFASSEGKAQSVATGTIYFAAFLLVLIINVAVISPAIQLLQPFRLLHLWRNEKRAITPRQRFRILYPRVYDPVYATACCLIAVMFAATFSLIFPLIGPAVCLLLFLTLIAHRYLIGYVYAKTSSSQTGGLLQIWLLRRLAGLVPLQPFLLGLIMLSKRLWALGSILLGSAILLLFLVETYAWYKLRAPGIKSLVPSLQESVSQFQQALRLNPTDVSTDNYQQHAKRVVSRGSLASIFEMLSLTLAVTPPSVNMRGPIPLTTESLEDLIATEQAARTNPNAAPRLPSLPFMTHSEEMQGILYSPELLAPPPIVWLPNDKSGVAQSEAADLLRFHGLKAILDVTSSDSLSRP